MKFTSRDSETNKERTYENNYEYRIEEIEEKLDSARLRTQAVRVLIINQS